MAQTTSRDISQTSSRQQTEGQQQSRTGLTRQGQAGQVPSLWRQPESFFSMSPFSLLRRLQEDMDQLIGNVAGTGRGGTGSVMWIPPIEVAEREGKLVISAEVPGLNENDIEIEVVSDSIVLRGERRQEREEGDGGVQRTERIYGEFYRVIPLPEGANPDQANARFENGVLRIEVPLAQSSRKKIPVQSPSSGQEKGTEAGRRAA